MKAVSVSKQAPAKSVSKPATVETLQAENAALRAQLAQKNTISFKVSEKGAVSIYGLGRFPTTLYAGQLFRLLERAKDLFAFGVANLDKLTVKEGSEASVSEAMERAEKILG